MKKYLLFGVLIAAFACSQQKGFKIKVNLEGGEGIILLEQRGADAWIPVDTAFLVNGEAVLEGEVKNPEDYYISVPGSRNKTVIFVENTNMTITGKVDSLSTAKVTGSASHDEYAQLNSQIQKLSEEYMSIYQNSREAAMTGDTAKARILMDKVNELYAGTKKIQEDFIKSHPASYVTPFLISNIQYEKDVDELDAMVRELDPKLDSVLTIVLLKDHIARMQKLAVGKKAPDFTQNDPDGNPITFSDIYSNNKYTLVDFWASWCSPCRAENPNVVAVYNEYKDKGFNVFGVSLDRDKAAWLKAIDDDNLNWPHVSDLAYWNNAAAQLYAVNSIPANLLVDENGMIVAKNKRGEELRKTMSELLD